MSRSFLPAPASPRHAYALAPNPDESDFSSQSSTFLSADLPTKMGFHQSETEPRVPTPFSRAYLFYFGLGEGSILPAAAQQVDDLAPAADGDAHAPAGAAARGQLRQQARGAFRGICAAFALREFFHLNFQLRQGPSLEEKARKEGVSGLYAMLGRSLEKDPHRNFWGQPAYYVLTGADGNSRGVIAGLSPLTGFFPAARGPSTLTQLYWFDPEFNRWSDPTETGRRDWATHDQTMLRTVRGLLAEWLREVLERLNHGTRPLEVALTTFGMTVRDVAYLKAEFLAWQVQLQAQRDRLSDPVTVHDAPLPVILAAPSLQPLRPVPFLEITCVPAIGEKKRPISDLIWVNNRVLVTSDDLLNPHRRLYGARTGAPAYREQLGKLSVEGDNLGLTLGLDANAIPLPYFYLNSLFTPLLTELTVNGFSAGWTGLPVTGAQGGPGKRTFLFPLDLRALEYLPRPRLAQDVALREIPDPEDPRSQVFEVTLSIAGQQVTQIYGGKGDLTHRRDPAIQADSFDLRFFPNFDLDGVPAELLPASGDRRYAARLRLSPLWQEAGAVPGDFIVPLRGGTPLLYQPTDLGNFEDADETARYHATGMARFLSIPERPDAFLFRHRGICLLDLPPAAPPTTQRGEWDVAVDFGTSNTCVARRNVATETSPEVLHLPMLTTSLLRVPVYQKMGNSHEGHSAALDFFHLDARDTRLYAGDFFPTQICTQRMRAPAAGATVSLGDGAVVFQNLSHTVLEERTIARLLTNFAAARPATEGPTRERPRFTLQQDIKWSNAIWMNVFMHHLRFYILLAAAKGNASIRNLYFSHPKVFLRPQVRLFEEAIRRVWEPNLRAHPPTRLTLRSESEGARSFIAQDHAYDYLVLDIGGGTTDVMAFRGGHPFYQTSFKLAADQVDRYLLKSPPLRAALRKAMLEHGLIDANYGEILDTQLGFTGPMTDAQEGLARTVWHGLLQHLGRGPVNDGRREPAVPADDPELFARNIGSLCNVLCHATYADAGTDAATKLAIQGFFLTILLTYGGLAFYGGHLERVMRGTPEGATVPNPIAIALIGNGGRYYHFLEGEGHVFHHAMEAMFRAGAGNAVERPVKCVGIFQHAGRQRPKAAIALGMLLEGDNPDVVRSLPTCNRLGESGFEVGSTRFDQTDANLGDFYRSVLAEEAKRTGDLHLKPAADSNFQAFLAKLHELLPAGKYDGHTVVPGLSSGWHERLLNSQGAFLLPRLRERVLANAREYGERLKDASNDDLPALEPVFISELAALLSIIRNAYAGGAQ